MEQLTLSLSNIIQLYYFLGFNAFKRVSQVEDKLKYLDLDVYQNRIVSQDELMNI